MTDRNNGFTTQNLVLLLKEYAGARIASSAPTPPEGHAQRRRKAHDDLWSVLVDLKAQLADAQECQIISYMLGFEKGKDAGKAERDRLAALLEVDVEALQVDNRRLASERDRLAESLDRYGKHDDECAMEHGGDTCTCGYHAAQEGR